MFCSEIDINWNENLPIYANQQFLATESNKYGWIGGFQNGQLIFILPFIIYEKAIFKFVRFPTENINLSNINYQNEDQNFCEAVVNYFQEKEIDFIFQPTTNAVFNAYPKHSIYTNFGSYIIDLTKHKDDLWKAVHSKHRNVIRNAMKKNIIIKEGNKYIDITYSLIKDTFRRSKIGFISRDKYIKKIISLGKHVKIYIAVSYNDEIQGCAVLPFSKYSAYYLYGGSITKPLTGALNYLHWYAINDLKVMGVKKYDLFGARLEPKIGSKLEGIDRFKRRFGSELKKGYLWKYVYKPWKYKLFYFIYKIMKNKSGDIIDQERKR